MTRTAPLLKDLLTRDESIAETAPDTLQTIAEAKPKKAADAVDALCVLLRVPDDHFSSGHDEDCQSDGMEEESVSSGFIRQMIEDNASQDQTDSAIDLGPGTIHTPNHRERAAWALGTLAPHYPDHVANTTESVFELIESGCLGSREHGLYAIGRIATETPANTEQCIETALRPALETGVTSEQALGSWALADIATETPSIATQALPSLRPLVTHDNRYTRLNAAEALCLLAQANPSSVASTDFDIEVAIADGTHSPVCAWAIARVSNTMSTEPTIVSEDSIQSVLDGHGIIDQLLDALISLSEDPEPAVRLAAAAAVVYLGSCSEELSDVAMPRLNELSRDSHSTVAATTRELIQHGPFAPRVVGDLHDIDPESYAVDLPVRAADDEQPWTLIGGLLDLLQSEGYNVYGHRRTAAVRIEGPAGTSVVEALESRSDQAVELGRYIRKHIDASEGESVTVEPVSLGFAQSVIVQLPAGQIEFDESLKHRIRTELRGQPVMPDDVHTVAVTIEPDELPEQFENTIEGVPVRIASIMPSEPVLITAHSEITVEQDERADFGEWWTVLERDSDRQVETGGWPDIDESETVDIDPEEIPECATMEEITRIAEEKNSSDER